MRKKSAPTEKARRSSRRLFVYEQKIHGRWEPFAAAGRTRRQLRQILSVNPDYAMLIREGVGRMASYVPERKPR